MASIIPYMSLSEVQSYHQEFEFSRGIEVRIIYLIGLDGSLGADHVIIGEEA